MALLIDYDNLQICAERDAPGSELDLRSVVALAQRYGSVVVARAYAEWNNPNERLEAYKAGIEPAFAPVLRTEGPGGREGKSLCDTVMVADGVDMMWSYAPDVFVLVTSDKDLIPLARLAKQRGSRVVVLGSDLTAVPLRELADDFFTYRRLVQEVTGLLIGGQAAGARREAQDKRGRQRPTRRETPTQREAVPAPAPVPALAEAAPPPEPEAAPVAEAAGEDRTGQTAARRRRRRGGRGRNRGRAAESAGAEGMELHEAVSPNGTAPEAEEHVPEPPPEQAAEPHAAPPADEPVPAAVAQTSPGEDQPSEEPRPAPRRRRRSTSTSKS